MEKMNQNEIKEFLMRGTYTAKLGTINKDGFPHITPIWFILDENDHIIFTTYFKSLKAKNLVRNPKVSICVDDQGTSIFFCYSQWNCKNND